MAITTNVASCIIVLGIVISIIAISSTILQDGYHVHVRQTTANKAKENPNKHRGSARNKGAQETYFPTAFDAMSSSDTIPVIIAEYTKVISKAIPNSNAETMCETIPKSDSDYSHGGVLLQDGRLYQRHCEPVGEHYSRRYTAQVNHSISSHVCSR